MRFKELAEMWLGSLGGSVRETTVRAYRTDIHRAARYLGQAEIEDITEDTLKDMEAAFRAEGKPYQTARGTFNSLRLALDYAAGQGLLAANPARHYTPDRKSYGAAKQKEQAPQDAGALLRKYPFLHPYHMPILLIYEAGLRAGEMLGLTWDAVNLKSGRVHVARQLVYLNVTEYRLTPLRADSLVRDVVLPDRLKKQLARWKRDQKVRGILKGDKDAFVCIEADGKPIQYGKFLYELRKQGFTPRGLRKTYEDKAQEAVTFLRERFSIEEIGYLRAKLLEGTQQQAYG